MSRVMLLKQSRDSLSVKFLEFTRIVAKCKNRFAIFFEGEDEKYYSGRIRNIRPDIKWNGVNCKGKSNVIEMRKRIRMHPNYSNSLCVFFVDADFENNDSLSGFTDIYITPCYSIENLYISDRVFEAIINAEFGISEVGEYDSCFKKALGIFQKNKSDYINAIGKFNCLIRELRAMEDNGDIDTRLNINNIKFNHLVDVKIDCTTKCYDESKPLSLFPELPEDISIAIENSENHFSSLDPETWYRGKQHLEFIRVFILRLKEDRCKKTSRKIFKSKGNVKLQLTKANCLSELSQYAETPSCLIEFLKTQAFNQAAA